MKLRGLGLILFLIGIVLFLVGLVSGFAIACFCPLNSVSCPCSDVPNYMQFGLSELIIGEAITIAGGAIVVVSGRATSL